MKKIFLTIAGSLCFGIAALHAQQVDSTGTQRQDQSTENRQSDQYRREREPRYQDPNRTYDSTGMQGNENQTGYDSTGNNGQTGQGYQYDSTHVQGSGDQTEYDSSNNNGQTGQGYQYDSAGYRRSDMNHSSDSLQQNNQSAPLGNSSGASQSGKKDNKKRDY